MLYLYGVVPPRQAPPSGTGIDDLPVSMVRLGGVSVAVSALDNRVDPTPARLAQHHRLTLELLRAGTVAPFRFGNVVGGKDELRRYLSPRAGELKRKLAEVAGCVEIGLQLTLASGNPLPSPLPGGEGTQYLLRKRHDLEVAGELRSHIEDLLQDWRQDVKAGVLSAACLVREEKVPELRSRLARFDPRPRITGPWPPSSFV